MSIPVPTIPSSTVTASAVELKPTTSNNQFYAYSGEINVTSTETTMLSINDIGRRDILLCFELGTQALSAVDTWLRLKSNGQTILTNAWNNSYQNYNHGFNEIKAILPANTSLEVTLENAGGTVAWTVAAYGYYL